MRLVPLLFLALASTAAADERFLHSIPLALSPGVDLERVDTLQISPTSLPASTRPLSPYAVVDGVDTGYTAASFVIDFDEPSVAALAHELAKAHGTAPTAVEIVRFTHDFIENKGYERGFEIASQVARHASGDCTEHAVLLTALARAAGKPARVVLGVVVVREGTRAAAYGHAWSEIYEDGSWQLGEATALSDDSVLGYVAVAPMQNESPGYSLPMVGVFEAPWYKGVVITTREAAP